MHAHTHEWESQRHNENQKFSGRRHDYPLYYDAKL